MSLSVVKTSRCRFAFAYCRAKRFFFAVNSAVKITAVLNNYFQELQCVGDVHIWESRFQASARLQWTPEVTDASLSMSTVNCNNFVLNRRLGAPQRMSGRF